MQTVTEVTASICGSCPPGIFCQCPFIESLFFVRLWFKLMDLSVLFIHRSFCSISCPTYEFSSCGHGLMSMGVWLCTIEEEFPQNYLGGSVSCGIICLDQSSVIVHVAWVGELLWLLMGYSVLDKCWAWTLDNDLPCGPNIIAMVQWGHQHDNW